jgi:hypothetical protein
VTAFENQRNARTGLANSVDFPATPGNEAASRRVLSRQELRAHPAVRYYMLCCLAALFVLVVCLSDRGLDWWCLVPPMIGCLTLLANWNLGPPLVLLSLAGLFTLSGSRFRGIYASWSRMQTSSLVDLLLCLTVLAYVVCHYRLLSLTRYIFTPDVRRLPRRPPPNPLRRRSPDLVSNWEMALLGFALPVWVGLAGMVWSWVMSSSPLGVPTLGIPRPMWRMLQLVWTSLALLAGMGIAASYYRRTTATPEESLQFLQDQCWRHTRREQSSLNRWLTWARLRAQRKKEAS